MSRTGAASGSLWKGVRVVSATSAAPSIQYGNGSPVRLGYRLDEIAQALVLADGDGEADIHLAADGYHAMSVEPAVGP